jgi:hypothetical protein
MARRALAVAVAFAAFACGSDGEVTDQNGAAGGSGAGGQTSGGSGGSGEDASAGGSATDSGSSGAAGSGAQSGTGNALCNPDAAGVWPDACTERIVEATPAPLDIVWMVDQSSSMDQEIAQVRSNINDSFASVIAASGIDYRVIMIADKDEPYSVCVDPPLGAATCGQDNPPIFFHIDQRNLSHDLYDNFMATFPAWQEHLRPGALRILIAVTDDESQTAETTFDAWLLSGGGAGLFGTAENRRYVLHSIVGIRRTALPSEVEISQKCSTAIGPGLRYQRVSILSGGLRMPVCETDYSPVFRAIADLVISTGACEIPLPPEPVDPAAVGVDYTPGGTGTPISLPRVAGLSACGTSDGFYVDGVCPAASAVLCPATCSSVRADPLARLTLRLGC